jgi:hypothetical protein
MVGGKIIENAIVVNSAGQPRRRLWCVDEHGDECDVYAEDTPAAASLNPGETCWWQSGKIYARNGTLVLDTVGFSSGRGNAHDQRRQ